MKYIDKNGGVHSSMLKMRIADVRSTNVLAAVKDLPGRIKDKAQSIMHRSPSNDDHAEPSDEFVFEDEDLQFTLADEGECESDDEVEYADGCDQCDLPKVCINCDCNSDEVPDGSITDIWYNINLKQFQFNEAGNPNLVIRTSDELTPEFWKHVYSRANQKIVRGGKLLINLMYYVKSDDLKQVQEACSSDLGCLFETNANIGLRTVVEVAPDMIGSIKIEGILEDSIVALEVARNGC